MAHEPSVLNALTGLVFVIGLIFMTGWILKKFGTVQAGMPAGAKKKRLSVIEYRRIDPKNTLLLVACDSKEYLIATGESTVLIDSFPIKADPQQNEQASDHD